MNRPVKRLYRSRTEAQIAGVCAGVAEYLHTDPVFVRLIVIAATLVTGIVPGILAYVAAWIITPADPVTVYQAPPASEAPPRVSAE